MDAYVALRELSICDYVRRDGERLVTSAGQEEE